MGLILAAALVGWLLHRDVPDLEVWPILLGGAAFFYLWWLAALLFDLTLVWHNALGRRRGPSPDEHERSP